MVDLPELVALFAGTELTEPCPTDALAERICERVKPMSVTALKNYIYGAEWPTDSIPDRERECMARGFTKWRMKGAAV